LACCNQLASCKTCRLAGDAIRASACGDVAGLRTAKIFSTHELAQPAVIIAPHADDEVLACGGTIIQKLRAGAEITVIFITDSSRSHVRWIKPTSMSWTRKQEAIAAADVLGLDKDRLVFLDFPETHLASYRKMVINRLAVILCKSISPALKAGAGELQVFIPYRYDLNIEHKLVNELAWIAIQKMPVPAAVFEYPVWFFNQWPWAAGKVRTPAQLFGRVGQFIHSRRQLRRDFTMAVAIKYVIQQKAGALLAYHSQVSRPIGQQKYPVLGDVADGRFLRSFFREHEIYHQANLQDQVGEK